MTPPASVCPVISDLLFHFLSTLPVLYHTTNSLKLSTSFYFITLSCREPRMWRLSCHWMRHRSQVTPARSLSWWQLILAGARRENSSISQLSALYDNNNLILKLREEVRLSLSVFPRKHAAWGLLSTKTNLAKSNMSCPSIFVTNSCSASGF